MPCNLILARLVKVSWQARPIFGPASSGQCRPIVGQTFLLFLARLCQFWPWPATACPGHADLVCFLLFLLNLGHGQLQPGQARLTLWPQLPWFFYPLANIAKARPQAGLTPANSGQALTPVWPDSWCKGMYISSSFGGSCKMSLYEWSAKFWPEGRPAVLWTPIFGRNTRKIHLISHTFTGKREFWTASFQCLAKSLVVSRWKESWEMASYWHLLC